MAVGQRIAAFIEASGLTRKEFSEKTGIPYRTLQDYISNKRGPGAEHLIRLVEAGADADWILRGRVRVFHDTGISFKDQLNDLELKVISDAELMTAISEKSLELADEFQTLHVARHGEPLGTKALFRVVATYQWHLTCAVLDDAGMVVDLRKARHAAEQVLEKLIIAKGRKALHGFVALREGIDIGYAGER